MIYTESHCANASDKAMRVIAGSGSLGASSGVIGSLAV